MVMDRRQGSTRPPTNSGAQAALWQPAVAVVVLITAVAILSHGGIWANCVAWPAFLPLTLALHALSAGVAALMAAWWLRSGSVPWFLAAFGTSAAVFHSQPSHALLAAIATVAVAAFAAANVYGRRPLGRWRGAKWLYGVALTAAVGVGGLAGLAIAVLPCLATAAFNSDARSVRFVLRPLNWLGAVLAGASRAWLLDEPWIVFGDGVETAAELTWALSPWWPIALTAIVLGVRLGHYATPFWRLCGVWLATGLALAVAGLATAELAAALLLPPLALISGHALRAARSQLSALWMRRGRQIQPAIDVALVRVRRRPPQFRPVRASSAGMIRHAESGELTASPRQAVSR